MVPFKFRVWDIESKEMMCPPLTDLEDLFIGFIDGEIYEYDYRNESHKKCVEGRFKLMQFTGLLDCDDKEIYEGDVLYMPEDLNDNGDCGVLYLIKFFEGSFWAVDLENEKDYELITEVNTYCRIVDNILECPELLGVKE